MCGCNKENDDNEPLERCCSGNAHNGGRRMIWLPYDDPCMITSQILSILAFLISWIWWGSFIISLIALVLQQIIWCCRQSKAMLLASLWTSFVAALSCLFSGTYMLIAWKNTQDCVSFLLKSDDDWYRAADEDYCPEKAYAVVAFVDAALWFASAGFTITFINSGRYAKWEEILSSKISNNNDETSEAVNVEMGNVIPDAAAVVEAASPAAAEEVAAVAVSTPEDYDPPKVAKESDVESPPRGDTAEA